MSSRGLKWRLLAVLFTGLVLGCLGLLEPLTLFWSYFHLVGLSWPVLLALYLGAGLLLAAVAALGVSLIARAAQALPITVASYYTTATAGLAAAIVLTPTVRDELKSFAIRLPSLLIFLVFLAVAVIIIAKVTPKFFVPLLRKLIGHPNGSISATRLGVPLVLILLIIPLTILKGEQSAFRGFGREPRAGLATRPNSAPVQNVLFLAVNSLRADHLGAYGYARPTSPALDKFANEAVLYEKCFAQGNCTELSFGSLFTSLYPSTHGVRRYRNRANPLAMEIETLPERMRDAGLETVGLMTNPFLKREWGLAQGFDRLDEFQYGYLELLPWRALKRLGIFSPPEFIPMTPVPRGREVADQAIRELRKLRAKPFFLFVHFMDTHHPYIPPDSFVKMFTSPGASQTQPIELWKKRWSTFKMLPSESPLLPPGDLARIVDFYDGSIRYTDEQIGRILTELSRLGLDRNTLVIVTGDHGDEFLDHGNIFHQTPYLYDELIHVPLMIRYPGVAPRREAAIVRHIDLFPTLLQAMDLPEEAGARGVSILASLQSGEQPANPPIAFSQSYEFVSVRTPERKLMYDLPRDGGYCFDLVQDPKETANRYGDGAAGCDTLEAAMIDFLKKTITTPESGEPHAIDPRTRRILGSLGYVDP
ncbi:MAG: sulfatase-like hydrolase/transferase [Candidatus Eisenbacteria bacterium]|nr:sulfatase-like hydrolase/transferase [Candidatus Eisenbacteria bacterium]